MSDLEHELHKLATKGDMLNPFKALDKVKGALAVFMFFTGVLPFLFIGFVKVVPIFLVVGGIWGACKGIQMLIHRSRRL